MNKRVGVPHWDIQASFATEASINGLKTKVRCGNILEEIMAVCNTRSQDFMTKEVRIRKRRKSKSRLSFVIVLTHLYPVNYSILIHWKIPIMNREVSSVV